MPLGDPALRVGGAQLDQLAREAGSKKSSDSSSPCVAESPPIRRMISWKSGDAQRAAQAAVALAEDARGQLADGAARPGPTNTYGTLR